MYQTRPWGIGYMVKGYGPGDYECICLKDPGKDNRVWNLFIPRKGAQTAERIVRGNETVHKEASQDAGQLQKLQEEAENLQKRVEEMKAFLDAGSDIMKLQKKKSEMERDVAELEIHREHLKTETRGSGDRFCEDDQ